MNTQKLFDTCEITFNDDSYAILRRMKVKYPRMYPMRNIRFATHRHIRKLMKEEINEQLISLAVH